MNLPPGPKQRFGGHALALYRDPLGFLARTHEEYGDIAYLQFGPQGVAFLYDPEFVKQALVVEHANYTKGRALQQAKRILGEGLLTSEGDFHHRQRRIETPLFHQERIAGYSEVMTSVAQRLADRWKPGQAIDAAEEMNHLSLAIVGKTLFDADVEHEAKDVGEALIVCLAMINQFWYPMAGVLKYAPFPSNIRFARAKRKLDGIIYGMIEERQRGGDRGDLLSKLLAARDTEGDGKGMSIQQVRDEAMTIFLAGHETTALSMAWTWYLLSQNPEAEARMHEELDRVLGGRTPTFEDVPKLPYTRMVLAESMRIFPPAWVLGRRAQAATKFGPYDIPKGSLCILSQFVIHRSPKLWKDPLRFDPQRWTPEATAARHKFSYFPFGGGPRGCIGERFAWTEGILILATLAQRWRLRLVPGHVVEPQPMLTLRPKHGLRMTVEARRD